MASASAFETTASAVSRGVGDVVVGPLVGAALSSREVRAAVWDLVIPIGLGIGAGVALGIVVGRVLAGSR